MGKPFIHLWAFVKSGLPNGLTRLALLRVIAGQRQVVYICVCVRVYIDLSVYLHIYITIYNLTCGPW